MTSQRLLRMGAAVWAPPDVPLPEPPKPRAKPRQIEAGIQGAVAGLLTLYERQRRLVWWPVPSGLAIKGGAKQGAIFRDRGLRRPGVPDIGLCLAPTGRFAAIELKAPDGSLTTAQVHFLAEMERAGGLAAVCRSVDEVKAKVDTWLAVEVRRHHRQTAEGV